MKTRRVNKAPTDNPLAIDSKSNENVSMTLFLWAIGILITTFGATVLFVFGIVKDETRRIETSLETKVIDTRGDIKDLQVLVFQLILSQAKSQSAGLKLKLSSPQIFQLLQLQEEAGVRVFRTDGSEFEIRHRVPAATDLTEVVIRPYRAGDKEGK